MKIHTFRGSAHDVEEYCNEWFEKNPDVKVLFVTQSESSSICLTIWYEEPIPEREIIK